jgi:hypothetical protein
MARKAIMTIYVDPEKLKVLKKFSVKNKVPVSEYIRYGIDRTITDLRIKKDIFAKDD